MFRSPFSLQIIMFCIVGGLGVITDHGTFTLLKTLFGLTRETHPTLLMLLPVAGYMFAVLQNYLLNHYWTFTNTTRKTHASVRGFSRFLSVSLFSLIPRMMLYNTILFLASDTIPHIPHIANLSGIVAGTAVNFIGSKYFVFNED